MLEVNFTDLKTMPKLPECDRCQRYAHSSYLVCSVHPSGVTGDRCLDFAIDPTLADLEELQQWEPVGANYYNSELVVQPPQLGLQQQLDLLDWHPIFTGRCPNCERSIAFEASRLHWDCASCGWVDDSV
jgi:hypothetical protein